MGLPDGAVGRLGKGSTNGDLAFSPNGDIFALSTSAGIWLYDAQTYEEIDLLHANGLAYYRVAFSPDGSLLAATSGDGADNVTSLTTLQFAITNWALSQVNA